jgi:hypothetical protein
VASELQPQTAHLSGLKTFVNVFFVSSGTLQTWMEREKCVGTGDVCRDAPWQDCWANPPCPEARRHRHLATSPLLLVTILICDQLDLQGHAQVMHCFTNFTPRHGDLCAQKTPTLYPGASGLLLMRSSASDTKS